MLAGQGSHYLREAMLNRVVMGHWDHQDDEHNDGGAPSSVHGAVKAAAAQRRPTRVPGMPPPRVRRHTIRASLVASAKESAHIHSVGEVLTVAKEVSPQCAAEAAVLCSHKQSALSRAAFEGTDGIDGSERPSGFLRVSAIGLRRGRTVGGRRASVGGTAGPLARASRWATRPWW